MTIDEAERKLRASAAMTGFFSDDGSSAAILAELARLRAVEADCRRYGEWLAEILAEADALVPGGNKIVVGMRIGLITALDGWRSLFPESPSLSPDPEADPC